MGSARCGRRYALSGVITRTWLAFFVGRRVGISGWEILRVCSPFVIFAGVISAGAVGLRTIWEPQSALAGIMVFTPLCTGMYVGGMLCLASGRRFLRESARAVMDILRGFGVAPLFKVQKGRQELGAGRVSGSRKDSSG